MTKCYFCNERDTEFFWGYFCKDCSQLSRLLKTNPPEKCYSILKNVLLRNEVQISNKIKQEIIKIELSKKNKVLKSKEVKESNDSEDYETPTTRSQCKSV